MPQKLADGLAKIRHHSISSLGECFAQFIPSKVLENGDAGAFSRRRVFSKTNTFWAFFSQVLDADGGCQEVVRKIQALMVRGYCICTPPSQPLPFSDSPIYSSIMKTGN